MAIEPTSAAWGALEYSSFTPLPTSKCYLQAFDHPIYIHGNQPGLVLFTIETMSRVTGEVCSKTHMSGLPNQDLGVSLSLVCVCGLAP